MVTFTYSLEDFVSEAKKEVKFGRWMNLMNLEGSSGLIEAFRNTILPFFVQDIKCTDKDHDIEFSITQGYNFIYCEIEDNTFFVVRNDSDPKKFYAEIVVYFRKSDNKHIGFISDFFRGTSDELKDTIEKEILKYLKGD